MDLKTTIIKTLLGEDASYKPNMDSKHYKSGYNFGREYTSDAGFKHTARARKKQMLSQNPHKKGSNEHGDWHAGAISGHEDALHLDM